MSDLSLSRLAAIASLPSNGNNFPRLSNGTGLPGSGPVMPSDLSYMTFYTSSDGPAATLSRPRMIGDLNGGLWTLCGIDGEEVATFRNNPSARLLSVAISNHVEREQRDAANAALIADAAAEGIDLGESGPDWSGELPYYAQRLPAGAFVFGKSLKAALIALQLQEETAANAFRDAKEATTTEEAPAEELDGPALTTEERAALSRRLTTRDGGGLNFRRESVTFGPLSTEEAAAFRAAAMRASVPAIEAAAASLSRRLHDLPPLKAAKARARLRIAGQVAALKSGAIPGRLAAFDLTTAPATYESAVPSNAARVAAYLGRYDVAELLTLSPAFGPRARSLS